MRSKTELLEPRVKELVDETCGLHAFVVIDDTTLGPACGGVRTRAYPSKEAALEDALQLARAMTYKCALANLPAGGCKGVVIDHAGLDRAPAFERLGAFLESLAGEVLVAGDLGTSREDLEAMARQTRYVYTDEGGLSWGVGRGCLRAIEACVAARELSSVREEIQRQQPQRIDGPEGSGRRRGAPGGATASGRCLEPVELDGLRVAVQGCGMVGSSVAQALADAGAELFVADLNDELADSVAAEVGAQVCPADEVLRADVDVVAPCAAGGVLTSEVVETMSAWGLCGAANNILADDPVDGLLMRRRIVHVPDVLSSSGAVIEGVGKEIMGLDDCTELIDRVGHTARRILAEVVTSRRPAGEVARDLARRRIEATRAGGDIDEAEPTGNGA